MKNKSVQLTLPTWKNMFYLNCIEALKNCELDVIMSVGQNTDIKLLNAPSNFQIKARVNQIEVLQSADVFISHSGMNSVNESLYYGVPLILFPQHSEETAVANRVSELKAGVILESESPDIIKKTVLSVLNENAYKQTTTAIGDNFRLSGGSKSAAQAVLNVACKGFY